MITTYEQIAALCEAARLANVEASVDAGDIARRIELAYHLQHAARIARAITADLAAAAAELPQTPASTDAKEQQQQ